LGHLVGSADAHATPLFLRLEGRRCVVIGGDAVAERKAARLSGLRAPMYGDRPAWCPAGHARERRAYPVRRAYPDGDLRRRLPGLRREPDDPPLIASVEAEAARGSACFLNVVDVGPRACSFFAPAVVARGDLQVAIGTGGSSPTLAARLRRDLEGRSTPRTRPT
jgi:siroheme synthase-like protein